MGRIPWRFTVASGMRSNRTTLRRLRLLAAAALGLALVGSAVLFGAAPAEASVPFGPMASAPAAASGPQFTGGFYYQYVFWQSSGSDGCTAGGLCETFWSGSWSNPINLYRVSGSMGSGPTTAVEQNGTEYVFWGGRDGHLWGAYYDGQWNGPICYTCADSPGQDGVGVSSNAFVDGTPAAAVDNYYGGVYVWWKGDDGNLWEKFWIPANGWSDAFQVVTPSGGEMGPLGSGPTARISTSTGGNNLIETVYWQGTNGVAWLASWYGSSWVGPSQVTTTGVMGSAPSAAYAPNGLMTEGLFWAGTDGSPYGNLWYFGTPACELGGLCVAYYAPMGSGPSAAGSDNFNITVFWKGVYGYLWEGVYLYGQGFGTPIQPTY